MANIFLVCTDFVEDDRLRELQLIAEIDRSLKRVDISLFILTCGLVWQLPVTVLLYAIRSTRRRGVSAAGGGVGGVFLYIVFFFFI